MTSVIPYSNVGW